MTRPEALDELRRAGARRRAIDEGTLPPDAPDPLVDGTGVPAWGGTGVGDGAPAGGVSAGGPWFDARAFFLGWAAMAIVAVVGASGLLVAAAGFGAAYLFARRSRVKNAAVSVGGAVVAGIVLLAAIMVIGLVVAG